MRKVIVAGGLLAGVVVLAALPRMGVPAYYVSLLTQMLIFALAAGSLDLLVGFTGLVPFNQASFFGAGAYAVALLATRFKVEGLIPLTILAALAAVAVAAIFGLVALRADGVGFIIITLALNEILWGLAYQWANVTGGDNGITGFSRPTLGPVALAGGSQFYVLCLIVTVLGFWLLHRITRSPFGLVLRGIRERPARMSALGYNVWRYRFAALLISGGIAGVAGALFAYYNTFVGPTALDLAMSTQLLIMVILGGTGTLFGSLLGSGIIVFVSNVLSGFTQRWELILGALYVVVLMYAPDGLVGVLRRLGGRFPRRAGRVTLVGDPQGRAS